MTDSSPPRHRVLLVTGLLGAGKTTVLRVLEDLGWESIDNFPIRLLGRLIESPNTGGVDLRAPLAIGFDSRTRGFDPAKVIERVKKLTERPDLEVATLFLDCSGHELERRYNETRRRHPLAQDLPASSGIMAEREIMEPLRNWADMVISTSNFSSNDLQQAIRERFADKESSPLTVSILVFDMRFLDNPHWDMNLRPMTGQDQPVADHVRKDPAFDEAFARIRDLILMLLPRYRAQGKAYVNIAFGCTGGRHRSVFVAEEMTRVLTAAGYAPSLTHRNLATRPADGMEGKH